MGVVLGDQDVKTGLRRIDRIAIHWKTPMEDGHSVLQIIKVLKIVDGYWFAPCSLKILESVAARPSYECS